MALSETATCTEQERRVADALIEASKAKLSGDYFWIAMAQAAIRAASK